MACSLLPTHLHNHLLPPLHRHGTRPPPLLPLKIQIHLHLELLLWRVPLTRLNRPIVSLQIALIDLKTLRIRFVRHLAIEDAVIAVVDDLGLGLADLHWGEGEALLFVLEDALFALQEGVLLFWGEVLNYGLALVEDFYYGVVYEA